jgi:hypothetical protein
MMESYTDFMLEVAKALIATGAVGILLLCGAAIIYTIWNGK